MTIVLTKDVRVGGSVLASGTTQTLAADIEADLVRRGCATPANRAPGVSAPGANHVADHKDIGGIPQQVVVSNVPFVIPPGDGAANGLQFTGSAGAFTLSAAIIANGYYYRKNGFWMYLPASFGGSIYPAGWYWATMSTDTAGIVYTNTYLSGPTVGPATPTAFPTNLSGWLTSTTSEIVGPDGFLLSGGALGKSGLLQSYWSLMGNATGTKSFFTLVGGTKIAQANTTTNPVSEFITTMRNAGTAQAQINTRSPGTAPLGVGATANATISSATFQFTAIDTDVDKTLSVSMSISANTACAILVSYNAFATYGA